MLKPANDRLNYGHLLTPPPDYHTDFALGASYSLDLEALVGVPMALFLSEEMNKSLTNNPIVALEGLRRSADQFAILCEAGQISVPQNQNTVFSLLENSVFEVVVPNEGSFHPKTWLIRYQNKEQQPLYRIIVLSRNLTFDRSWDLAVCLEGFLKEEKTHKNKPLQDFVEYLRRRVQNRKKRNQISRMIAELDQIYFEPANKHITDYSFCPLGIPGYQHPPAELFDKYKDLLIISPFISKKTMERFDGQSLTNPSKTLITRRIEISKLKPEMLESFQVYAMKETVVEGEEGLSGDEQEEGVQQNQDIHAKFYARSKHNQHTFYIGSANCTERGFNGSVEFLLQLHYQKWGFRISNILDDLFGKDDRENPFERIETIPEIDITDTSLTDRLEKGIKQLCRTNSKATVSQERLQYQVKIEFTKVPQDIEFTISPLAGMQQEKLDSITILKNLQLEQLSEFYHVTAAIEDTSLQRIIKILTTGIPEGRDKAVFKTIIRDQKTFMKYIAFLLSDSLLITSLEQLDAERLDSGKWDIKSTQTPVFYENMLKTAAREPERLQEIERVVQLIDDPEVIPEGFIELYNTFIQAAKKVKR